LAFVFAKDLKIESSFFRVCACGQ